MTEEAPAPSRHAGSVLALDVGERRIGVAATDALGLTAQPLPHIARGRSLQADMDAILAVAALRAATRIVVGHPLGLRGERRAMTRKVERFFEALQEATSLPCELWDERFTTAEAERTLEAAGVRREERRQHVDSMAAALLLDTWMRHNERHRGAS